MRGWELAFLVSSFNQWGVISHRVSGQYLHNTSHQPRGPMRGLCGAPVTNQRPARHSGTKPSSTQCSDRPINDSFFLIATNFLLVLKTISRSGILFRKLPTSWLQFPWEDIKYWILLRSPILTVVFNLSTYSQPWSLVSPPSSQLISNYFRQSTCVVFTTVRHSIVCGQVSIPQL